MHIVKINFSSVTSFGTVEDLISKWQLFDMPNAICGLGAQVTLLQLSDRACEYSRDNVRLILIPAPNYVPRTLLNRIPLPYLYSRLRTLAPDVIHVEGLHFPFQIYWLEKFFPHVPLFIQDHANKMPVDFLRSRFYQRIYKRVDGVLFTSKELAGRFFEIGYFPKNLPVFEVLEGTTTFVPSEEQSSRDAFKEPKFVAVGDLVQTKDPLTILLAFKSVLKNLPGATLDFYFRRDFMSPEIKEFVNASDSLRDRVSLMGGVEHKALEEVFRNSDYFISGSLQEGGAYSLIEALACGVTPVVTNIPVHRTILKDGLIGKLYRIGDHDELASKIVEAHSELSSKSRRLNRKHFEKYLSLEITAERLMSIYGSVKSKRSSGG